jgi:hypothetical protein
MPLDSDPVLITRNAPDSFVTVILGLCSAIKFKQLFLLFIIYIILSSDVFASGVLSKFEGATELGSSTSYGIMLTGLFLMIGLMVIDASIDNNLI